jgi:OmcA/MtrC family decaheme c-type cytochrome
MKFPRSGLVLAAGLFAAIPVPSSVLRPAEVSGRGQLSARYPASAREHYLSDEELGYVRPGLHVTVNSITIDPTLHPVVDVSYTDDANQPLDRSGAITVGSISMSFVLAWWDPNSRNYTSYTTRVQTSPITHVSATQAAADSGGTWNDISIGHSTYTFHTALPANYDTTVTTTVGIYATRSTADIVGKDYYANAETDFVPNGSPVTQVWDMVNNAACNQCHNPLAAHGGSRQDTKLCVLCHSPQTTDPDTGNTVDFKVMIHKIHDGENLPSVQAGIPYQIIGFQQSVNDFSTVVFPQDIRNCATCHSGPNPPSQAFNWYTYPERASCGSCHDNIDWTTGANHPAGPQADDSACANCHIPDSGHEWDASVKAAHTVPYKSTQLKGVNAQIVSVTNTAPGQNPTIVFNIAQNDGTPIPPSAFTTQNADGTTSSGLNVLMSGPTTDYAIPPQIRERADGATASEANYSYTFTNAIPAVATGTWGFSIEARLTVTLNPAPHDTSTVKDAAFNPVSYATVTDSAAVPRRVVVDIANCNTCHDKLMFHGSNRLNPQECVFCHNPNANDGSMPPESIDFKRMIHKIHRGENLTQNYTIGDTSFNDVRFPGDLRDCQKCHTTYADGTGTEQVFEMPPPGLLPTPTPKDWYTPMQHYATACLACHDTEAAAAHAFVNTATFPSGAVAEACAVCHGEGAEFSVDQVHAR